MNHSLRSDHLLRSIYINLLDNLKLHLDFLLSIASTTQGKYFSTKQEKRAFII